MLHVDFVILGGKIYTQHPAQPWVSAIAVRDGKVVAIGDDTSIHGLTGPATTILRLHGQLVLPGLCDAHIHLYHWMLAQAQIQLATCRSKQEMLARIAVAAQTTPPGTWLLGQGWNESWWGESTFPTADDLDPVTGPDHPTLLWRSDLHLAVVNRAALRLAGIDANTPAPPGSAIDHDHHGNPTGILREQAAGLVARHIPAPTQNDLLRMLPEAVNRLHRLGITAIHDQRVKDGNDGPIMLSAYTMLHAQQALDLRLTCNIAAHQLPELVALGLRAGLGDDVLQLGHVKVFADGSLGSRTAWMLEPYAKSAPNETDNYGLILTPPAQMAAEFLRAHDHGFPISVHAIGDQANRAVLDIFTELAQRTPRPAFPHRIEHVQTIHPNDQPRLAQLDLTASVQPIHQVDDREVATRLLGPRGDYTYPFRSLLRHGARLAFGSDAPVADANPFLGIHAALARKRPGDPTAWNPNQALTLDQIIHAYTLGPAEAVGKAATLGRLAPGYRADLVVLDRNLFALAQDAQQHDAIADARPLLTLFDGRIVHRDPGFDA